MKKKRTSKAKRLSVDRISTLPQPIIEIILSLLPTREAARTSILSREWRYKWLKIPNLKFYSCDIKHTASTGVNMDMSCQSYCIHQVLLRHQGPINELALNICKDCDTSEFDKIMLHLAKNHTVEKLTVCGWYCDAEFDLSKSIFSFHHLTDLYLSSVDLKHQPKFDGFGSLRSLVLEDVGITTKTLLHILSNSPSLKIFNLHIGETLDGEKCTIVELFKCLHAVEHLTTHRYDFVLWLDLGLVPRDLPSFLFHLKYFCFEGMSFFDDYGLSVLRVLIKCAPNLEKIKLEIDGDDYDEEYSFVWEEYSDVYLESLIELEIGWFFNLKVEMEFVKFILARSPKLKKLSIRSGVSGNEKLKMLEVLLEAPRSSPVRIYV